MLSGRKSGMGIDGMVLRAKHAWRKGAEFVSVAKDPHYDGRTKREHSEVFEKWNLQNIRKCQHCLRHQECPEMA